MAFAGFSLFALAACDGEDVAEAPDTVEPQAEAPAATTPPAQQQ